MKRERPTWLEIDLDAISNNIQQLQEIIEPHCILMAVIKANAYGHGALQVAKTVIRAGADRLAVAAHSEALELRQAGIDAPILILGYTPVDLVEEAIANDITLTIYDYETAKSIDKHAAAQDKRANIHVKINTGMNRLGLRPDQVYDYLTYLKTLLNVQVEGIYTHFATADEADQTLAHEQFKIFQAMLARLEATNLRPRIAHAANSAATLSMPETHLDMVRPGIAIYGLHPDPKSCRLPASFRPALTWKAEIAHINELDSGEAVSYGREFTAEQPMQIAVIPVGYADGFPRKPNHWPYLLVKGKQAPIVGRVCMDQTMIDISSIQTVLGTDFKDDADDLSFDAKTIVKRGDEVVLLGGQNDAYLSAEFIANHIGTNNYDVVSRILSRVPRIYI